jgi:hypothetical protein
MNIAIPGKLIRYNYKNNTIVKKIRKWLFTRKIKAYYTSNNKQFLQNSIDIAWTIQNSSYASNNPHDKTVKMRLDPTMNAVLYSKMADSFINELVGIQPLSGPVGLVSHADFSPVDANIQTHAVEARTHRMQQSIMLDTADEKLNKSDAMRFFDSIASMYIKEIEHNIIDYVSNTSEKVIVKDEITIDSIKSAFATIVKKTNGYVEKFDVLLFLPHGQKFKGEYIISPTTMSLGSDKTLKIIPFDAPKGMRGILTFDKNGSEIRHDIIYAPYIPFMSAGVVMNPKTFQPVVPAMTRGGMYVEEEVNSYIVFEDGE